MTRGTKRLIDTMIRDQDVDVALLEFSHGRLYVLYSNRVNISEGLVQRDKPRIDGRTVNYLDTSTLIS